MNGRFKKYPSSYLHKVEMHLVSTGQGQELPKGAPSVPATMADHIIASPGMDEIVDEHCLESNIIPLDMAEDPKPRAN